MKKLICIISLAMFMCTGSLVLAQNKVVVIPLGGSSKVAGTDGQIQYNDWGKAAGAELYYDKVSGKLQTSGELRTVDQSGRNRLWGQGRPGTTTLSHDNPNGYCTTDAGIKFALSTHFSTWGNAASVCPVDTWVCSNDEVGSTICDVSPLTTYNYRKCDGTYSPDWPLPHSFLWGWLADSYGAEPAHARLKISDNVEDIYADYCNGMRVWCCWQ